MPKPHCHWWGCPNYATIGGAYCDDHRCLVAHQHTQGTYECSGKAGHEGPCAAIPICPKCGGECELFDQPGRREPALRCLKNGCTWNMDFTSRQPPPPPAPIDAHDPTYPRRKAKTADQRRARHVHRNTDNTDHRHVSFWRRFDWVDKTPIVTTVLLESANVQQLYRMWTEHSALGQSLTAWICVNVALLLWLNFYRVKKLKWALYSTIFGVTLSSLVSLTVFYFRYLA